MRSFLPRVVFVLGFTSMFNDVASDMIAPLLPLFLTTILGAGPAVVGLMEGLAETTSSVLKLVSGRLADRGWNRKKLVVGGYTLSNVARPLIGVAVAWPVVLVLRFFDRVGKGIRTSPRDAIISGAVGENRRGRAFGVHRALDHSGAMIGPLIAFLLLQAEFTMQEIFLISALPGVLALVVLGLGVPAETPRPAAPLPPLRWRVLDARLRGLILAAGGLALAAVPEAFLVLWAAARGLEIAWVPLIWVAAHAVKAMVAGPAGALSDRLGRLPVVLVGWGLRVVLLVLLGTAGGGIGVTWLLFLAYAGALAFTEGAERALIGDVAPHKEKATAFGLYHLTAGALSLPGAFVFGVLWQAASMPAAFLTAAVVTAISAGMLLVLARA